MMKKDLGTDPSRRHSADDDIGHLIAQAGPRPAVPTRDLELLKATARREWVAVTARPAADKRSWFGAPLAAAAAGLLATVAIAWWWLGSDGRPLVEPLATVELIRGDVWLEDAPAAFEVGGPIAAGTELVTGSGDDGGPDLLAIRLGTGQSVRLDRSSRLRLVSSAKLELLSGGVYVDSGEHSGPIEILTPHGSVFDVGTQFEVRLSERRDTVLLVRVRSGSVALTRAGKTDETAAAGEEMALRQSGLVERDVIAASGPTWDWILAAAPSFSIEGRTLESFLGWVETETAWKVEFESPALAESAASIELHGPTEGLRPDEAVGVVLPSCGLEYRLERGVLHVESPDSADVGV